MLDEFIASNPEPRELKRALAVKMRLEQMKHRQIQPVVGVSSNYISRWEQRYREQGVEGLKLAHKGSQGYLSDEQRQAVIAWIAQVPQRNLWHQGQKKALDTMNLWCSNTTKGLPTG